MFILTWFLSPIGKWVGIAILAIGLLLGARACLTSYHNAGIAKKIAEQQLKVYKQDQASKQAVEGMTNEEMAEFLRTGKFPLREVSP